MLTHRDAHRSRSDAVNDDDQVVGARSQGHVSQILDNEYFHQSEFARMLRKPLPFLAVEAIDGTDATIERGGRLGDGETVLVKICKPNQDFRFDVPAVGVKTIETMHRHGVRTLAIEADKTLVFDREEMVCKADEYNISIVCE